MNYVPKPVDTDSVELPPELLALTEKLAENAHDVWAAGRMKEGWSYGARRDDSNKKHPDLIPYSELSDSEKEYDRQTAVGTLKAIAALGYRILPPENENRGR